MSGAGARADDGGPLDPATLDLLAEIERLLEVGAAARAVELLEASFPEKSDVVATWPISEPLVEPARAAVEQLVETGEATPAAVRLLVRGASYFESRSEFAVAQEWLDRVGELQRSIDVEDPVHTAAARAEAELLLSLDAPERARRLLEAALERDIAVRGEDDRSTALDRNRLSYACDCLEDLEMARAHAERAIETLDALGPPDEDGAHARRRLAVALAQLGEPARAVELMKEALAIVERTAGAEAARAAEEHGFLGYALMWAKDLAGAQAEYQRALEICEATVGSDHNNAARFHHQLGSILHRRADFQSARPHLERAVAISERTLPSDHSSLWFGQTLLANTLEWLGDYEAARPHRQRALAWVARVKGMVDLTYARALEELGWVLSALGETEEGLLAYRRALEVRTASPEDDDSGLAGLLRYLARAEWDYGSSEKAIQSWTHAIEIEARSGTGSWAERVDRFLLAHALRSLSTQQASAYEALGHVEEAKALESAARETFEQAKAEALASDDPDQLQTSAFALVRIDALPDARSALEHATRSLLAGAPDDSSADPRLPLLTAQSWGALGRAHRSRGDLDEAMSAVERQVSLLAEARPSDLVNRGRALTELARMQREHEDGSDALASYREAVTLLREAGQADALQDALHQLGRLLLRRGDHHAARAAFEERLAALTEIEPARPYEQGVTLHDIALIDAEHGDLDQAVEGFREAAACKQVGAVGDPARDHDVTVTVVSLARALLRRGRTEAQIDTRDEAAQALGDHLAALDARDDADPRATGLALAELGVMLWHKGARDEAVTTLRQAVASYQQGGARESTAEVLEMLGNALAWLRQFQDALDAYSQRLELLEAKLERQLLEEGETLDQIARMERELHDLPAAIEHYRDALARKRAAEVPASSHEVSQTLLPLGRALVASDELQEALDTFEERLALLQALPERSAVLEGVTLHDIADVHRRNGDLAIAVDCFRRAVEQKRAGGAEEQQPGDLAVTLRALARALRETDEVEEADVLEAEAVALERRAEEANA